MNIAVIGSRDYCNKVQVIDYINSLDQNVTIVSGGARGVDTLAEKTAIGRGLKVKIFKPDYNKYGRKAPLLRNYDICKYSDMMTVFWNGKSPGSKHAMNFMKFHLQKPVTVFLTLEIIIDKQLKIPGT